ncbi:hypothetical protein D9M71_779490 [compost metagenome]
MISASWFRRGSGTGTMPTFGSIVQNGKLAAAIPALVSALNRVDLPTLGRPTMPHLIPMLTPRFEIPACALHQASARETASRNHGRAVCNRFMASLKSPATASGITSMAASMA